MQTIIATHGKAYRSGGFWQVDCTFQRGPTPETDRKGRVSGRKPSILRKRLVERGMTEKQVKELFAR